MGDIHEDDGGTEGKASAQLLQPKTRSVADWKASCLARGFRLNPLGVAPFEH
jgi:hypothetical protein